MTRSQFDLFSASPALPDGFRYQPEVLSREDERALLDHVRALPFRAFDFHGYVGRRRVVSYGGQYDFDAEVLRPADDLPPFLHALRVVAAAFAGLPPERLVQTLVTEYPAGAAIGWHRDKAVFGDVVGISLLAPCIFRLRRPATDPAASAWDRVSLTAAPRSAYLLRGPARTEWEHSIPAVAAPRYSVTFRSLRANA